MINFTFAGVLRYFSTAFRDLGFVVVNSSQGPMNRGLQRCKPFRFLSPIVNNYGIISVCKRLLSDNLQHLLHF